MTKKRQNGIPRMLAGSTRTLLFRNQIILFCIYCCVLPGARFFKEESTWHPISAFIKYTSAPIHLHMQIRVRTQLTLCVFKNNYF